MKQRCVAAWSQLVTCTFVHHSFSGCLLIDERVTGNLLFSKIILTGLEFCTSVWCSVFRPVEDTGGSTLNTRFSHLLAVLVLIRCMIRNAMYKDIKKVVVCLWIFALLILRFVSNLQVCSR